MKRTLIILMLNMCWFSITAQRVFDDAVEFNDFIMEQQYTVSNAIDNLVDKLGADSATIWTIYYISLPQVKLANQNVQNLQPFQDDSEFLSAAQALFNYYEQVFENDYAKFINHLLIKDPGANHLAELNLIITTISTHEVVYNNNFMTAQMAFADKFGFQLSDFDDEIWDE